MHSTGSNSKLIYISTVPWMLLAMTTIPMKNTSKDASHLPPSPSNVPTQSYQAAERRQVSLSTTPIPAIPLSQSTPRLSLSSPNLSHPRVLSGMSLPWLQFQWAPVKPAAGTSLGGFLGHDLVCAVSQPIHSQQQEDADIIIGFPGHC